MKKAVMLGMLLSILALCSGLSSYGDSPDFSMDTVDPLLQLFSPNGGETWYIGDTKNIEWNAVDTNLGSDCIELGFSLNGGADYASIAEAITNSGTYAWELPAVQTLNAKVQIQVSEIGRAHV